MVKLSDVAVAANVSTKTASRVVNGRPNVRDEVRDRVFFMADILGYEHKLSHDGPTLVRRSLNGRGVTAGKYEVDLPDRGSDGVVSRLFDQHEQKHDPGDEIIMQ